MNTVGELSGLLQARGFRSVFKINDGDNVKTVRNEHNACLSRHPLKQMVRCLHCHTSIHYTVNQRRTLQNDTNTLNYTRVLTRSGIYVLILI